MLCFLHSLLNHSCFLSFNYCYADALKAWTIKFVFATGTEHISDKCLSSEWCMGECEDLEIFNWKIIALQCCIGFWHMTTRISHEYTYVCSLLSLPPTPLRCCRHPAGLPASYHYTWWCIHANPNFPVCPTLSFLCCAHKSVLYIFISIPALQIGSSI